MTCSAHLTLSFLLMFACEGTDNFDETDLRPTEEGEDLIDPELADRGLAGVGPTIQGALTHARAIGGSPGSERSPPSAPVGAPSDQRAAAT